MADNWYRGNAAQDGDQYRGWLLGHFIDPAAHGIRHTTDLEVKWGIHPAGQTRPGTTHPSSFLPVAVRDVSDIWMLQCHREPAGEGRPPRDGS